MRLKATPADFVVQEATALRIRKQPAPYRVYMLEKTDWNTADALMRIAREQRVPYDRFGYGGKKDRHAHTYQYVTVQAPRDLSCAAKGYTFRMLGFSQEPMTPARIVANNFTLTVRELTAAAAERLLGGIPQVQETGVPNYFDDQRFGSLDKERGFIAERMLQGDWARALEMALTAIHPEEHREAKERKRALREHWGDWAACRALARTALEQRACDLLLQDAGAHRAALATVHPEQLLIWVSTYQSYLWNETLRRLLERRGWAGPQVAGVAGPYVFPTAAAALQDLVIPLPGRGMRFPDPESERILAGVLAERGLRPAALAAELLPGVGLRASPRPAAALPGSIWADGPAPDERYPGHQKVTLRFSLPRGSYATMVIKGLLA